MCDYKGNLCVFYWFIETTERETAVHFFANVAGWEGWFYCVG